MLNRVVTGTISSMYLIPDQPLMGLVVVSPEGGHYRADQITAPVQYAPMYHLGMEVLIDTVEHVLLVQQMILSAYT